MRHKIRARAEYVDAFREIASRIANVLTSLPKTTLPIKMYVAGGAALHFYLGERVSRDIDAAFSHRIALPDGLEVAYRDVDNAARVLYFDRQYNDTYALMHESAYDDSERLELAGVEASVLDVRLLTPTDLAVSKIGRLSSQDREDIAALARNGLVTARVLRRRAEEAAKGYVGDTVRIATSIDIACRIVEDATSRPVKPRGNYSR